MNLDDYITSIPTEPPPDKLVPNQHPTLTTFQYKLAIIGEAPGADEAAYGKPFVGMSGRFLTSLLSKAGIVRDACFIGNICQHRPPNNDIKYFRLDGPEILAGLSALTEDLAKFKPNVCLLLGKTALWAAKGTTAIGDWRGSWFISDRPGPFYGRKCIAAYHPAAALRQYEWMPLLMFDIKKAFGGAKDPSFTPPLRDLRIKLTVDETLNELDKILLSKPTIAVDIEGYVNAMTCISIAPASSYAFIVPFAYRNNISYYPNIDDEVKIWRALSSVLADPQIPKILQNGLYDRFVLQYSYGVVILGCQDDTMLKWWELYPELPKGLAFQASVITNEPYWKSEKLQIEDR